MSLKLLLNKIPAGIVIVILLSLLPLGALLHVGFPQTHDGMDHLARIANFYNGLNEGIAFPRWAENLNWGYGHPILMFLYPLSSYLVSLFHFLSFSYIDSLKIVMALGFIGSGITMYFWARAQCNEYFGIAAALLYLYAPYRFVDMYVRGAIGEHMAFIFPPLILYYLFKYFYNKKSKMDPLYYVGISISFALLLLAHNAISIMFIPLFSAYAIFLSVTTKQYNKLFLTLSAFVVGLFASAFFTFPAFLEGKFTLRDIVTGNEYKSRFVTNPLLFLYSSWSYGITGQFSVQIGIAHILGILISPIVLLKTRNRHAKYFIAIIFVLFLISLFLMLSQSNFLYSSISILKKFQFPWRFLSLTAFTSSIIGASIFLVLNHSTRKIILAILICILVVTTFTFWKANGYIYKSDSFYNAIYSGTSDTGESSPVWSIRFMEHLSPAHMEAIDGQVNIQEFRRLSTKHKYRIVVYTDTARMRENTLFFPNWTVKVDGKLVAIQFQDPSERGLITFNLKKGTHVVEVIFKDTKLRVFSNFLSIVTILGLGVIVLATYLKKNEK